MLAEYDDGNYENFKRTPVALSSKKIRPRCLSLSLISGLWIEARRVGLASDKSENHCGQCDGARRSNYTVFAFKCRAVAVTFHLPGSVAPRVLTPGQCWSYPIRVHFKGRSVFIVPVKCVETNNLLNNKNVNCICVVNKYIAFSNCNTNELYL